MNSVKSDFVYQNKSNNQNQCIQKSQSIYEQNLRSVPINRNQYCEQINDSAINQNMCQSASVIGENKVHKNYSHENQNYTVQSSASCESENISVKTPCGEDKHKMYSDQQNTGQPGVGNITSVNMCNKNDNYDCTVKSSENTNCQKEATNLTVKNQMNVDYMSRLESYLADTQTQANTKCVSYRHNSANDIIDSDYEGELSMDYTHEIEVNQTDQPTETKTYDTPPAQLIFTTKGCSTGDVDDRAAGFIHLAQNKNGADQNKNKGEYGTSIQDSASPKQCDNKTGKESISYEIQEMDSFEIIDPYFEQVELDTTEYEKSGRLAWERKVTSPEILQVIQETPTAYGGLKKLKSHATTNIKEKYGHDFDLIRTICEKDGDLDIIDCDPRAYGKYKRDYWPQWAIEDCDELAYTYTVIRDSGIPNSICEKVPIQTKLKIENWEKYLPEIEYKELIDGMRYGYSLGYTGPISYHSHNKNHSSAENFPQHIDEYIKKELEQETLMGPFDTVPFEFCHTSPLMTRIKTSSNKRRIISDHKFPTEASINAYIPKNTILGKTYPHHLPKSDDVVASIDFTYNQYFLYTLDIENAYKNLPVCPLDWPLLTFKWKNKFYIENRLPFGSRNSSVTMQRVAMAIIHILKKHNITAWMYLDDLLVMSKGAEKAQKDVKIVTEIFNNLGLPTVPAKAQGPQQAVIWIGVLFDMQNFTISVPEKKLQQVIENIQTLYHKENVTLTEMQSVVGKIVHISKCIIPSRIFTSRILSAMRKNIEGIIQITHSIRKDFDWFLNFVAAWNGTANMNPRQYIRTVETFYEEPFIMASDANSFYICNIQKLNCKLSEIQASVINIAMAIDIFSLQSDCEGQTLVTSNVKKAVHAYNVGNTKDEAIDQIVRANWFTYALVNKDYKIVSREEKTNLFSELLNNVRGVDPYSQIENTSKAHKIIQIFPDINMCNEYINKLHYRSTAQ